MWSGRPLLNVEQSHVAAVARTMFATFVCKMHVPTAKTRVAIIVHLPVLPNELSYKLGPYSRPFVVQYAKYVERTKHLLFYT